MTPSIHIIDIAEDSRGNRFAPYQRMANVIIERTMSNGACLPQDLLMLGFTKQEARDLWHMLHAMARVELRLMEGTG